MTLLGSLVAVLMVGSVAMANLEQNQSTVLTSSVTGTSHQKIEWGIKRAEDHKQPDLGKQNRELIEKYDGMAMGNSQQKYIYLTFDLGYEAGYTNMILDVLKKNNVKAAFFITAHYVNTSPDIVKRMIEEGHDVGNHTVNHKSIPSLSEEQIKEELMNLHTAVYDKFQYEMKYMRPPKGEYSDYSLAVTTSLGYVPVMWSFAYADWDEAKQPTHEEGIKKIMDNTHNGEIMLLHATSKTNSEILDTVIKQIKSEGYEFKSLDEFCK